ncbi:MAG: hypothetical protein MRY83_10875 [Flavobacteriales bacterium]|nr:hypothetical protein [Flavobacteriales bacterium]
MARKYEIERGKKPNEEKLQKSKDFKRLIYNYEQATKPLYKRPIYKDPKAFLAILLILLIIWILTSLTEEKPVQPLNPLDKKKIEKPQD